MLNGPAGNEYVGKACDKSEFESVLAKIVSFTTQIK